MNKKEKINKSYSAKKLLKDLIVTTIIALYIVMMLGDIVYMIIEDSNRIISRQIPVVVTTILSTFVIIRSGSKRCHKSEEKMIKKDIFIAPVIVAVIIMFYGFYSVSSNIRESREDIESEMRVYSLFYSEDEIDTEIDKIIAEAANQARKSWIIIAAIYLVSAEVTVFISSKKLSKWLKEDIQPTVFSNEIPSTTFSPEGIEMETNTLEVKSAESLEENSGSINNINWNL